MIWREKRVWLIALGLALAADIFVFVTYRVQFQKRIDDVKVRKEQADARLAQARASRLTAQDTFARYRKIQADLDVLYNTRWATQTERLTPWINEIKHLATASQMVPKVLNFTKTDDKDSTSLVKNKGIGTTAVTINYSVQGNYQQVRRLINLMELSDQFVIIDSLGVASNTGDPNQLTLTLRLKTLFREPRPGAPAFAMPVSAQQVAATPNQVM
jgi:hypothetical protein